MGGDGVCKYIFKCERCGDERRDRAVQDGSGDVPRLHERWEAERCACGGKFQMYRSEVWYGDDGVVHVDPRKYFQSEAYRTALRETANSSDPKIAQRAKEELTRLDAEGVS